MSLRLYNARLIDAAGERAESELFVDDAGRICAPCACESELDCKGLTLAPALIDLHTHLRDPGFPQKETMQTGMLAAVAGGFSTLVAMANTKPVMSTPALVEENLQKSRELGLCHLIQAAAAGENLESETPTDWAALARVTKVLSNDGKTITSEDFMRKLLLASAEHGFLISTHCQPERETVARDLRLLRETGGRLHIGHISRRETLDMIREAKASGLKLTCEVTPHHLFACDSEYRVNPPLRRREDVKALIEGARDGSIDCLSTDHAPHTPADKRAGMAGISNIDHALSIWLRVFYENGIPYARLFEMACATPARLLALNRGRLDIGYEADLILVDTEVKHPIRLREMRSHSHNTPFAGRMLRGRNALTMIGGNIVFVTENCGLNVKIKQKK